MSDKTLAQDFAVKFFNDDTFGTTPTDAECWEHKGIAMKFPTPLEETIVLFTDGSAFWWSETGEREVIQSGQFESWIRDVLTNELTNLDAAIRLAEAMHT